MKIIISPTKKMRQESDLLAPSALPLFLEESRQILTALKSMTLPELKALWACNDKLAGSNYERLQKTHSKQLGQLGSLTAALLAYEGIAFQYMGPTVFEEHMLAYVQEHLRILSGFYGILRPMDAVLPYRLEMQAKLSLGQARNLYQFWGNRIYDALRQGTEQGEGLTIVNLASKEYARCIRPYLRQEDRMVDVFFGELVQGKPVQKGVYAKMARGDMVRYLAQIEATEPVQMKDYQGMGYVFCPERSHEELFVFLRDPKRGAVSHV